MTTIPSFGIKTALYNTSSLQNLGASLSQFIINPTNLTTSITLTPSQLNNLFTSPVLLITGPSNNEYIVLNYVITELFFNSGATSYGDAGPGSSAFSYNNSSPFISAGVNVAHATIIGTTSEIAVGRF